MLLAGVAVLLVAAVAGGIFAVIQRGEARDAETAQLAQRLGAQALVEEDLDLSLLLARQAVAIDDSPQTRGYLLDDLQRSQAVVRILHGKSDSSANLGRWVAVSPDGRTLAVGGSRRASLLRRPDLRADRRAAAGDRGQVETACLQPGRGDACGRRGRAEGGGHSACSTPKRGRSWCE